MSKVSIQIPIISRHTFPGRRNLRPMSQLNLGTPNCQQRLPRLLHIVNKEIKSSALYYVSIYFYLFLISCNSLSLHDSLGSKVWQEKILLFFPSLHLFCMTLSLYIYLVICWHVFISHTRKWQNDGNCIEIVISFSITVFLLF